MDAAKYRCISDACGKSFPRQVNFCPYCGTRQKAVAQPAPASEAPVHAASASGSAPLGAAGGAAAGVTREAAASASAGTPSSNEWGYAPSGRAATQDGGGAAAQTAEPGQINAAQQAALDRLNKVRGVPPAGAAAQGPAREPGIPMPPKPGAESRPPLRKPVSMSSWALAAILLAVIWFLAKPSDPQVKLEARIVQAIDDAGACKIDEARAELAALKTDKASAAQLKRVQEGINRNAPGCEKKRQRGKAWTDLRPVLEGALDTGDYERAASRLAAFTKRWGPDDDTRDWGKRIDIKLAEYLLDEADSCLKKSDRNCVEAKLQAAKKLNRMELGPRIQALTESLSRLLEATILEQKAPPAQSGGAALARSAPAAAQAPARTVPSAPAANVISTAPQTAQATQQARKILADAERELSQGNYKGAMDKADICATMIDVGNRECLGLKQRAERLNREMLRCVASGADWINDRCQ